MVLFDVLRISDDGKRMYINFHVNQADYFKDIYLDSIVIQTADMVSETNPHTFSGDYIYKKVYGEDEKEDALVLQPMSMNEKYTKCDFTKTLFFVYIKVKGVPDPCTPCRLDEEITLGVTFDENLLYQKVMSFTKGLADDCTIPVGFTDFILLWNAFKASVETEHYVPAIKYWSMLFNTSNGFTYSTTKPCGCHG